MYILGKDNVRADTLSRRNQDMLTGVDVRTEYCTVQLLKPQHLRELPEGMIIASPVQTAGPVQQEAGPERSELELLWDEALQLDRSYDKVVECLLDEKRTLPSDL
jgi:hypothetical protein